MQHLPSNTSKPVYQDQEQMSINLLHDYAHPHVAHRLQESGLTECHATRGAWQPAYSPDFWPCDLWAVNNHRPYIHAGRLHVKVVVQGFRRQLKEFFADTMTCVSMGILSYTCGKFLELLQYHKLWASSNRFVTRAPHHSLTHIHEHTCTHIHQEKYSASLVSMYCWVLWSSLEGRPEISGIWKRSSQEAN